MESERTTQSVRMQREHQKVLERNYITLLNHMDVGHVRDRMVGSDLFGASSEDVEKVKRASTRQEAARLIIESLVRKGPRAFEFLVRAMSSAPGNEELAATLARGERTTIVKAFVSTEK